jgi:prepilin-type N-terminal cleavage/methylation domain-containing protein
MNQPSPSYGLASTNRHESSSGEARPHHEAFTLLELLVVIAVIAVLAGLLFPSVQSVLERAKKVQATNDLTQIVTAVNAFYTEYGRYPTTVTGGDANYGPGATGTDAVFKELRAVSGSSINTRQVVFISPPEDATQASPRGKIGSDGQFHDPWATAYSIKIDANYDNQVGNPYESSGGAGPDPLRQGVVAWSLGKDKKLGNNGDGKFTGSDDVISWQ